METFTFMIAVLLMMVAVQFNQNWMVFAIVALMVLSTRSLSTTILLLVATFVLLVGKPYIEAYWPFVLFGLIILSLIIGGKQQEAQQPAYPEMFGGGEMGGIGFGGF